jgi:hypothetical protein
MREHKIDLVVISEIGQDNFSSPFLRHLSGGANYSWFV